MDSNRGGTVDAIFIFRQIIEKKKYQSFIDFKAAFDTVWRKALWKMFKVVGVNPKIINIMI